MNDALHSYVVILFRNEKYFIVLFRNEKVFYTFSTQSMEPCPWQTNEINGELGTETQFMSEMQRML